MQKLGIVIVIALGACAAEPFFAQAQSGDEEGFYRNRHFGYRLHFPAQLFQKKTPSENGDGASFATADNRATVKIFGAFNDDGMSINEYRSTILKNFSGYENIDYGPVRRTWFVLSGTRGERIYYQKVIFSCGGKVVNILAINYPKAEKKPFDPIVEGLEKSFRPASGDDCPRAEPRPR